MNLNLNKVVPIILNKLVFRPLIKFQLHKVGTNFKMGYSSEILNTQFFTFGDNFYSGPYGYFVTNKNNPVVIGDCVMFGPFCKIIGGNHDTSYKLKHMYYNKNIDHLTSKIIIENGVWIGASCVILSGSHIGEGSIIGAMSLVNHYIPPYIIAVGSPAIKYKRRFLNKEDLIEMLNNVNSKYTFENINEIYKSHNIEY